MESPVVVLALRNMLALEYTARDAAALVAARAATTNIVRAHQISEFTVRRIRKEIAVKYDNRRAPRTAH